MTQEQARRSQAHTGVGWVFSRLKNKQRRQMVPHEAGSRAPNAWPPPSPPSSSPRKIRRLRQFKIWVLNLGLNRLDSEGELDTDVDLAGHLDDLGELHGLFGGVLEVLDGEDLEAGLVDLGRWDVSEGFKGHNRSRVYHTSL